MRCETEVVKKILRKHILGLVCHFYLDLENIKIRHQVYIPLLHSLSILKYLNYITKPE